MRQRTVSLVGSLMLAGLIAIPATAGITLRASKQATPESIQIVSYLSDINEPLKRALRIHNIMNDMPSLRDMAQTAENLKKQNDLLKQMQENISACNVKRLGKVFKDPQKVWGKMMSTYEEQRQESRKKINDRKADKLTISLQQRQADANMGWTISRKIMMDVYENPEKWGDVNKGESFPLWKDQITLFEKQWNQFYENLNAAYGVPLKGRPAIDEETRHNAKKYDAVLAAHKAYVDQISEGRRPTNPEAVKGKPPKAPKALPKWQDIVHVDPLTGRASPEMPEPWKQMSDNKFKNYAPDGEMGQFFEGKSLTSKSDAGVGYKSDLEQEYEMGLAIDSMEKGAVGTSDTQQKMVQPFVKKLEDLGIDTKDFDIGNRGQYVRVQKELKDLKKAAIKEAYEYVEKLEEQDKKNPNYAARRAQARAQKQARLSAEAQAATAGMENVIQISQMSPTVQQRLILSALEKDESASVYLTQTNAINVDQLMREQKSTDKIIAESYQQINSVMEKQREAIPQMAECTF